MPSDQPPSDRIQWYKMLWVGNVLFAVQRSDAGWVWPRLSFSRWKYPEYGGGKIKIGAWTASVKWDSPKVARDE
jgi:hypothetical protein